ncbi:hypothetical protein [Streptomyces hirsutus]|uniref:hypothetical protein n=1 Tax=Streptomyces hirsutus TaxID=35620 RepID=UPI0033237D22
MYGEQNNTLFYLPALAEGGVELAEIEHCAHFPVYSNPPQVWARIADLVSRADTGSWRLGRGRGDVQSPQGRPGIDHDNAVGIAADGSSCRCPAGSLRGQPTQPGRPSLRNVLRATVMARTPRRDGRPERGRAAFDTAFYVLGGVGELRGRW